MFLTCEYLDLKINSLDPLQQTTKAPVATEDT